MGVWTVDKEITLLFRPIIDTGGPAAFFWLGLVASLSLDSRGVVVACSDASSGAARWLGDVEAGFAEFQAEREEQGKPLGFLRLEVTRVIWHEADTRSRVVRYVSREALREVFRKSSGGFELPDD